MASRRRGIAPTGVAATWDRVDGVAAARPREDAVDAALYAVRLLDGVAWTK